MEPVLDMVGWPIRPGARVERYSKRGRKVSQNGVVISVEVSEKYPEGIVHYEAIGTMNRGVTSSQLVRVMPEAADREKRSLKMQRYDHQRGIVTEASELLSRRAKGMRRVVSPKE